MCIFLGSESVLTRMRSILGPHLSSVGIELIVIHFANDWCLVFLRKACVATC